MSDGYPLFGPKARFITRSCHPNINSFGFIYHPIFDRNWIVDTANKGLIDMIYSLLLILEFNDPMFRWDQVQLEEIA
ncbi:hypothetical protein CC78DRAFT_585753 [Lojkania enalia]|uniref:UBC core domain-containing protein n=1 Tax=Lojkania enalia TaxID=147567 RepID=A0A9P4JYL2_9PLEO|nr:hypothetical protein CC78DRAFT_585753 [Didymosphaeria enalia]